MKVFLSWSGQRSKLVAEALNELLPGILQPIRCWMSESDLPKGKPWFDELVGTLSSITFAVVCVTKENIRAPWMLWEAGFLSLPSALGDRRVAPLAIGFTKESLDGPLAVYQGTDTTREDILRLTRAINEALPTEKCIPDEALTTTFGWGWPKLEEKIKHAIETKVEERPVPQANERDQLTEILAILRQQQRQAAEVARENEMLKHRISEIEMRAVMLTQEREAQREKTRILEEVLDFQNAGAKADRAGYIDEILSASRVRRTQSTAKNYPAAKPSAPEREIADPGPEDL